MNDKQSFESSAQEQNVNPSNSKQNPEKRSKVRNFFLYGKCFGPIFIAHHPECEKFGKNHTINIGRYHFCIGCFVGYPVAFLTFFILILFNLETIIPMQFFLITSIIFIGSFILSPLNLTKVKIVKIVQKTLIGSGFAFLLIYIRNLPNTSVTNRIILNIVFLLLMSVLNFYHALGIIKTCYKCETPFDWGHCSGFKSITTNMEKYNLRNLLLELDDFSKKILEKREQKQSKKKILK